MNRRATLLSIGALVLLVPSLLAAVAWGSAPLALSDVLQAVLGTGHDPTVERIVWQLRMPRALMAVLVGGGLSITGVAMQALVRNPLADPYILGLSSGASAGISLFYFGLLPAFLGGLLTLPLVGFLGGLGTIVVVYAIARSPVGISVPRLLLAGVAMASLMGAISSFVTFAFPNPNKLQAVLFLILGTLDASTWRTLLLPSIVVLVTSGTLWFMRGPLDALLVGEETAHSLGVSVEPLKRLLLMLSALTTGVLVAYVGAIGFVGLIVPHAVRSVVGVPHARLLPASFLCGGLFLLWADLLARTVFPSPLPVGIITALCGVPFFLYLIRRGDYRFG
ncbi:MAG: iron ABC transporter permease [Rhodothermales bacterium]